MPRESGTRRHGVHKTRGFNHSTWNTGDVGTAGKTFNNRQTLTGRTGAFKDRVTRELRRHTWNQINNQHEGKTRSQGAKSQQNSPGAWHIAPLPEGASRTVHHPTGRGGGRPGGLTGHGDRTGQEASRAAPVLGAMAGQGTRVAMAERGAWAAMAERGARVAMAGRGTREAMVDRGAQEAMAERRAWEAMAGSPPQIFSWGFSSSPGGALGSRTEPAGALESRTEPAGALESRTGPAGPLESRTGPAGALESWTGPAGALESRTGPAGPLESRTGPAGALESWTEPAGALESWTEPAGALESWTEPAGALESWTEPAGALESWTEQALEGAREARTLGGAREARRLGGALAARRLGGALAAQRLGGALAAQRLGGALAAQRLGGALAAQRLGGALAARSWTGPAGMTESWTEPAGTTERACEQERACEGRPQEGAVWELAPEGAVEEQAQEGAVEEQALGLGSTSSPHMPPTSPEAHGPLLAGLRWLAGLRVPRMVRGLRWPRMAADFPQTAGWTSRRRRRRFPANGEQGRAAGGGGPLPREQKQETKNFSKREENKTGWKWRRGNCILVGCSVTMPRESGTRRHGVHKTRGFNHSTWNTGDVGTAGKTFNNRQTLTGRTGAFKDRVMRELRRHTWNQINNQHEGKTRSQGAKSQQNSPGAWHTATPGIK